MKIYLDGADLDTLKAMEHRIDGVTTNPSLMRKAGIDNYKSFAAAVLMLTNKPVSFEVFADDFATMESQAREIASWGENVYVKIPVCLTDRSFTGSLVRKLSDDGIKLNITAIMGVWQVAALDQFLSWKTPTILSVFAGRIADTGVDPMPTIAYAKMRYPRPNIEVLWASTREVYNVKQAEKAGADIITMTPDLIKKMDLFGKDLAEYSAETVAMFYNDAKGITL